VSNSTFAKQKVFLVDDDKQIADTLSFVLREAGFDVETFYDPLSALMRASDCLPDVLVSDIDMLEMNGVALAGALQAQNPNCKVILISGNPDWKARRTLQGGGREGFVLLPSHFCPANSCNSSS
jgi:DNA-binding NtrC family response regulator